MKYASLSPRRRCLLPCSSEEGGKLLRSLLGAATLALLAAALLSIVGPAAAAPGKATLRGSVAVRGEVVTIGDFFDGAAGLADRPLFRAPDLGTTGPVSAARVVEMAHAAGLGEIDTGGLIEVSVTRLSRPVEAAEIARLIAVDALRRPGRAEDVGIDDVDVAFDVPVEPRAADLRAGEPVRLVSLTIAPQTGRFDALVQIDQGDKTERLRLRGVLVETAPVTVLARSLARGDTVAAEDLRVERQPRNRLALAHAVVDPREIVGLQARRQLRAGQAVAASEFMRPLVVSRGDIVTLVYRTRALQITGRGQALQAGSVGDLVPVLNPQSKRTLHGTVTGHGLVEIAAPAAPVATLAKVEP
jgi:flagella basal body P-ring formation protein FlgA